MNNPAYDGVIKKASDYVQGVQQDDGGTGYNPSSRSDLSNTVMSVEALKAAGLDEDSAAFKRAAAFAALCQNNAETNKMEFAAVVNDGGFIYRPGDSKAGEVKVRGKVGYKSYGLMSYAGLVVFLWAGVDRDDPRVRSAFRWVENNWTLEENRNLEDAGLYYYYLTMAKALRAYGQRRIKTSDGVVHDWPQELADKVVSLQKPDGSWVNANSQWFESDSVLVTAYAVRTLSICHEVLNARDTRPEK
jgi:squalene-hopene/tetraprenyl-beta-curcumene cyclase